MKKYVAFTKGYFRATQGIGIEPRAYEAIQHAKKLRKKNPKIPPLKLTPKLQAEIARIVEDFYENEIEPILGYNPLNGKILPNSPKATQGIPIEPRAYEAIQHAKKLRKENPKR